MQNQTIRSIIHWGIKIVHYSINLLFPKSSHKIVFMSGPDDYVDNARALSDYILGSSELSQYEVYWIFRSRDVKNVDPKIKSVYLSDNFGHLKYFYHTVTSKYLFSTHGAFEWACHYKQTYLCLWHGTMLKRIAYMQDPVRNKFYMRHCYMFASPSQYYTSIIAKSFNKKEEHAVVTGYPRVDLLFHDTDALEKLNINRCNFKKIVMYMPTFRQAINTLRKETNLNVYEKGLIQFSSEDNLNYWNNLLQNFGILLIVKPHPSDNNIPKKIFKTNIRVIDNLELASVNVQLYHLLHYADALITDFSSVFCDYIVLDRPIGFIITDIDEYSKGRGFVFDSPINYMPGEIITDESKLKNFFYNLSQNLDNSIQKRKVLRSVYNDYYDCNNCKRVLKEVGIL